MTPTALARIRRARRPDRARRVSGRHDLDRARSARSATRGCPGARVAAADAAAPCRARRARSSSGDAARRAARAARRSVQSTIVDSTPTAHGPPSSTTATSSPRSARTAPAVVGLTRPKRFADGAASPPPNASSSATRDRMVGHAQPDGVEPAGDRIARRGRLRGTTTVSGPGQNASASVRATGGTSVAQLVELRPRARGARSRDGRPGDPSPRRGGASASSVRRVGAEPVDGLGRERDQAAAPQHGRPADVRRSVTGAVTSS